MSKANCKFEKATFMVEITVIGPLLTRSVEAQHFSEDQLGLVIDDRPALPGTLVKGVFRAALEEMVKMLPKGDNTRSEIESSIGQWFGPAVHSRTNADEVEYGGATEVEGGEENWDPERGLLNFPGHWLAEKNDLKKVNLTRIRIDDKTGIVDTGALLVACSPIEPGQRAVFRGSIESWLPRGEVEAAVAWLGKASILINAVGGATSVGFGTVESISIGKPEFQECTIVAHNRRSPKESECHGFGLRLIPDRPFCFARPHGRSNVLESDPFIPGGAIIGAVAESLQACTGAGLELLRKNLHAIHVSHAQPSPRQANGDSGASDKKTSALPMSLGCVGQDVFDFSRKTPELTRAPVFAADWKSEHEVQVRSALRLAENQAPNHVSIVRNRIDPVTGAAAESALFAMDAIDPAGHEWRSNVSIDAEALIDNADPKIVLDQFRGVLALGLIGLGKTKARAKVDVLENSWPREFEAEQDSAASATVSPGGKIHLLLVTGADMLGPVEHLVSTGGKSALGRLYQGYFDQLFGEGRLKLEDWFTQETLVGGRYIYRRFWDSGSKDYRPHVMTAAGSLFVLAVNSLEETEIIELTSNLKRVRKLGLPPGSVCAERASGKEPKETVWQRHPWLPAQGYGEVIVNPVIGMNNEWEKSDVAA